MMAQGQSDRPRCAMHRCPQPAIPAELLLTVRAMRELWQALHRRVAKLKLDLNSDPRFRPFPGRTLLND
jgi:hypothetical protein